MDIELKRYVSALRKRLWIIVLLTAAAGTAAGLYTVNFIPNYYTATNKLIVNKTIEVVGGEEMDFSAIGISIRLIDTYKEIILTPAIMDKVVERYPELGLTTNQLIGLIRVNSLNETQVMTLTATDVSYERAARAVNAVSDVFRTEIPKIMKIDNVMVLTEAKVDEPTRPFGQNLKQNVAMAIVVSLMLSVGLIVLLEYLDSSFKSEEEVWQTLGVPSFASIPKMKKRDFLVKAGQKQAPAALQAGEQPL